MNEDTRKALQWASMGAEMRSQAIAAIDAALSAPATPVAPAGWVTVPADPTPEMAKAGCYLYCSAFVRDYKAMIAAAPGAQSAGEPLTYDQIVDALVDGAGLNLAFRSYEDDMKFARAIERAHGITKGEA